MGPALAVIGAVAAVGGTVLSYNAQKKAAKAARKQQELSTQRSNRQAIREAQLRRAEALAAAASMGALGGSSIAGGLGSLGSQLGSGLGFSSQMSSLSADIEKYQQRASMWGSIASMGGTMFSAAGGFGAFSAKNDTSSKAPTPAPSYNNISAWRPPTSGGGGR